MLTRKVLSLSVSCLLIMLNTCLKLAQLSKKQKKCELQIISEKKNQTRNKFDAKVKKIAIF